MQDEDALMALVARGDVRAFEEIVRAHQETLVRFAARLLGDDDAARDAVQESFVRLWRVRMSYQGQAHLRGYLLRITRHICIDFLRARQITLPLDAEWKDRRAGPGECAEATALGEAVRRAVLALPEAQRVVFTLSQYEGLSYAEIAQTLGCPLGTVASRKRLAAETLRRSLHAWMELETEEDHDL